jgi:soluble lytic murein transglycosylase-like protein
MTCPPSSPNAACSLPEARRSRLAALLLASLAFIGASAAADDPAALAPEELAALRVDLAAVLTDDDPVRDRFDAEVWLHAADGALRRFLGDADERLDLLALVWHEAARHEVDPEFALAVMEVESSFDRFAISSAGAQGLMQIMPFWKRELGRDADNLTDPTTNVRYGMTILAHYLDREDGDAVRALTRYHGNRRDLSYPERVYRAWNRRWRTTTRGEARALMQSCYAARLTTCDPD